MSTKQTCVLFMMMEYVASGIRGTVAMKHGVNGIVSAAGNTIIWSVGKDD